MGSIRNNKSITIINLDCLIMSYKVYLNIKKETYNN